MAIAKKFIRNLVLPGIAVLGLEKLLLASKKKTCLVVNFHGVRSKTQTTINNRHLPVAEFEKTIAYFSKNFNIVPLSALMDMRRSGNLPKQKTIALTFDDGYLNNFETALPILKKYNVPATYYIISKCLQDPQFLAWPDALDLYYHLKGGTVTLNNQTFAAPQFRNAANNMPLADYLKTLGADTVTVVATIVGSKHDTENKRQQLSELLQLVTADQLKQYSTEPLLEIGSHSHAHYCMEYLSDNVALEEFLSSKKLLETCIGKPVSSFAFPDGSYTKRSLELCKEAGYKDICAVNYKHGDDSVNKDLVARFTISNSTTHESNILRMAQEFDKFGF